jgi:hypothetical protein
LTIAGKLDKTNENHPRKLAIGVFNTLGISEGNKLNKQQFIQGYRSFILSVRTLPSMSMTCHSFVRLRLFSRFGSDVKMIQIFVNYSAAAIE